MRRFLAFAMCLSGFTLTFSWSRAADPGVAEDVPPASESSDLRSADPPSRPVVVRTEPGSHRESRDVAETGEVRDLAAARQQLTKKLEELQEVYTSPEFVEQMEQRLKELRAILVNNTYSGEALGFTEEVLEKQIASVEEMLENVDLRRLAARPEDEEVHERSSEQRPDVYREMRRRREQAGNAISEQVEQRLQQLRETAEELIESGAEQAEVARREIEQEIDKLEHYLAERRERRDAAEREPDRPRPADEELHQRMRHIQAAIEHLNAAGMHDVANDLRKHAEALQHQAATQHALREQQQALERQQRQLQEHAAHLQQREAAVRAEAEATKVRAREVARTAEAREGSNEHIDAPALAEQLGDLRREVRRLRQEVQELREAHARPNRD